MAILISHRGNLKGPNLNRENSPEYIEEALSLGFDVEIDVWFVNKNFYLGHDNPKYLVEKNFLKNKKIWCHAKNLEALTEMRKNNNIHYFWHQEDDYTLTSQGYIWAYPEKLVNGSCIDVLPELNKDINLYRLKSAGICSDYISEIKIIKD